MIDIYYTVKGLAAKRQEDARLEAQRLAAEASAAAKAREEAALAALQLTAASTEDPDEALDTETLDLELVDIFLTFSSSSSIQLLNLI